MNNTVLYASSNNPWHNLAVEEYIMKQMYVGNVVLYLWQNENTVVIGKNQNAWKECRCELLEKENGYLARRSSGGGAVYHDLGNLNFTFAASPERYDVQRQLSVVLAACKCLGIEVAFSGRNDITTMDGRKFSGNAFQVTQNCCMHHGTLLISTDFDRINRYLNPSKAKMESKGISSVRARVCNLNEFEPELTPEKMCEILTRCFEEEYGPACHQSADNLDRKEVDALYQKYASWEWRYRKTPVFNVELENRFSWGDITLCLNVKEACITDVTAFSDVMDATLVPVLVQALKGCDYGPEMAGRIRASGVDSVHDKILNDIVQWLESQEF